MCLFGLKVRKYTTLRVYTHSIDRDKIGGALCTGEAGAGKGKGKGQGYK